MFRAKLDIFWTRSRGIVRFLFASRQLIDEKGVFFGSFCTRFSKVGCILHEEQRERTIPFGDRGIIDREHDPGIFIFRAKLDFTYAKRSTV